MFNPTIGTVSNKRPFVTYDVPPACLTSSRPSPGHVVSVGIQKYYIVSEMCFCGVKAQYWLSRLLEVFQFIICCIYISLYAPSLMKNDDLLLTMNVLGVWFSYIDQWQLCDKHTVLCIRRGMSYEHNGPQVPGAQFTRTAVAPNSCCRSVRDVLHVSVILLGGLWGGWILGAFVQVR